MAHSRLMVMIMIMIMHALFMLRAHAQVYPTFTKQPLLGDVTQLVYGMAAGDLDNDGNTDIVVSDLSSIPSQFFWLRNLGSGRFEGQKNILAREVNNTTPNVQTIQVADVTGDGWVDIVSGGEGYVTLHQNLKNGTFVLQPLNVLPQTQLTLTSAVVDMNGDGLLDIVGWRRSSSLLLTVIVYFHSGVASNPYTGFPVGILNVSTAGSNSKLEVVVEDFDRDGLRDVLLMYREASVDRFGQCIWHRNLGARQFGLGRNLTASALGRLPFSNVFSVSSADFNLDGDPDVVFHFQDEVRWMRGLGNGSFASSQVVGSGRILDVVVSDVDGDGYLDIVIADNGNTVKWYPNSRNGNFGPAEIVDGAAFADRLLASDFDADGRLDLASANSFSSSWYRNERNLIFSKNSIGTVSQGVRYNFLQTVDLNGDRYPDVVGVSDFSSLYWIASRNGSGYAGFEVLKIWSNGNFELFYISLVGIADMDNDGNADIAIIIHAEIPGRFNFSLTWYRSFGNGTFQEQRALEVADLQASNCRAAIADLDADGRPDWLLRQWGTTNLSWVRNLGNGQFASMQTVMTSLTGEINGLYLVDLDNDGLQDLVVQNRAEQVRWYKRTTALFPMFGSPKDIFIQAGPISGTRTRYFGTLSFADLDNDGWTDVFFAKKDFSMVWFWNNRGTGFDSARLIASADDGGPAMQVLTVDIDIDGDLDIFSGVEGGSTAIGSGQVRWFENVGNTNLIKRVFVESLGAMQVADMDQDGLPDLVNAAGSNFVWFRASASPTQQFVVAPSGNDTACSLNRLMPCRRIGVAVQRAKLSGPGLANILIHPGEYLESDRFALDGRRMVLRSFGDSLVTLTCANASIFSQTGCLFVGSAVQAIYGSFLVRGGIQFVNLISTTLRPAQLNATIFLQATSPNGTEDARITFQDSTVRFAGTALRRNLGGADSTVRLLRSFVQLADCDVRNASSLSSGGAFTLDSSTLLGYRVAISSSRSAARGGAIHALNSKIDILSLRLEGNEGGTLGGALSLTNSVLTTLNLTLSGNSASGGSGGIYAEQSSVLTFNGDLRVIGNVARLGSGGAIGAVASTVLIAAASQCLFSNNSANRGGALHLVAGASVRNTVPCVLQDNIADLGGGGAIYASSATLELASLTCRRNRATQPLKGAGGVLFADASSVNVVNSIFDQNTASAVGGAVYCAASEFVSSPFTMSGSVVSANQAGSSGGGMQVDHCLVTVIAGAWISNTVTGTSDLINNGGAAMAITQSAWPVRFISTNISFNVAQASGGAVLLMANAATVDFAIQGGTLRENRAVNGGGGVLFWTPDDSQINGTRNVIINRPSFLTGSPLPAEVGNAAGFGSQFATPAVFLTVCDSGPASAALFNQTSGQLFQGQLAICLRSAYDQIPLTNDAQLRLIYDPLDSPVGPVTSTVRGIANFTGRLGLRGPPASWHSITFRLDLIGAASSASQARMTTTISVYLSPCPPGTYLSDDLCIPCDVGAASAISMAPSCLLCSSGSYANTTGLAACRACEVGKASDSTGASTCRLCDAGRYGPVINATECSPCPAGSSSNVSGRINCTVCPPGRYSDDIGATSCRACEVGTVNAQSNATQCIPCQRGTFINTTGQQICGICAGGTFTESSGASACSSCERGSYLNLNLNPPKCELCGIGQFSNQSGLIGCTPCVSGTYADQPGTSACRDCEIGRYAASANRSACSPCGSNQFKNVTGSTACDACDLGTYTIGDGATVCLACAAGQYLVSNSSTNECPSCPAGSFGNVSGRINCTVCPPGRYSDDIGATSCRACEVGTVNDQSNATQCTPCQRGTFVNATGQQVCDLCPSGTFTDGAGASACSSCERGSYLDSLIDPPECKRCQAGQFANRSGLLSCEKCSSGRYADRNGSSDCSPCTPGFVTLNQSAVACGSCPSGQFTNVSAQSKCQQCPVGTYNELRGASFCRECEAGSFTANVGSSLCEPCAPGTFADMFGQTACQPCPAGTFVDRNGSSFCLPCASGEYTDVTGQSTCKVCGQHQFIRDEAANRTACERCPYPSFADRNGSSYCDFCESGFFPQWAALRTQFQGCVVCPQGASCDPISGIIQATETIGCPSMLNLVKSRALLARQTSAYVVSVDPTVNRSRIIRFAASVLTASTSGVVNVYNARMEWISARCYSSSSYHSSV